MPDQKLFTVRPTTRQPRNDQKDTFRVYLSPSSLLQVKLRAGDLCQLSSVSDDAAEPRTRTAIAWTAAEKIHDSVIQTTKLLQELYGLRLGDKISITRAPHQLDDVESIKLEEQGVTPPATPTTPASTSLSTQLSSSALISDELLDAERPHWEWALEYPLIRCEIVAVGMAFELDLKGARQRFKVIEINSTDSGNTNTIYKITDKSKVIIGSTLTASSAAAGDSQRLLQVKPTGIGGLGLQIERINDRLQDFNITQDKRVIMPSFYKSSSGILIYGSKGTGKSILLSKIAEAGWRKTFTITSSVLNRSSSGADGAAILRKIFSDALKHQPSLITIDQIDFIAPKRGTANIDNSVSPALCEGLDSLQDTNVLVVAATRHPNDVDETLRTPHRLGIEVELQIPTAKNRLEILTALRGSASEPSDELLVNVASRTHGYVGADLFSLLQLTCRKAKARLFSTANLESSKHKSQGDQKNENISPSEQDQSESPIVLNINGEDISSALREIRPTAMREVFLETPNVRWTDIGGQTELKERLRRAVERPIKNAERMRQLNMRGNQGVLLYGPPGCSKTLMVKALATEAGLNFLAVKGAEVLSMYVGESERTLREIFRKAREASPSILFFDEIDAIGSKRQEGGAPSGVNLLTTLLNEMDGIEELKNVLIIAATNKPEELDPALMRPGRLGTLMFVGLPDHQARKELFDIWVRKADVDASVDTSGLASTTEGYTGAELVGICETAAEICMDEEEAAQTRCQITNHHLAMAMGQVPKQTSPELLAKFAAWHMRLGLRNTQNLFAATCLPAVVRVRLQYRAALLLVAKAVVTSLHTQLVDLPRHGLPPRGLALGLDLDLELGHLGVPEHQIVVVVVEVVVVYHQLEVIGTDAMDKEGVDIADRDHEHHPTARVLAAAVQSVDSGAGVLPEAQLPHRGEIIVEKLTKNVNENHLREIFGAYGEIQSLELPMNRQFMTNRGTAYIHYNQPADAEAAIAHMHEAQLDGAVLSVSIILPRLVKAGLTPDDLGRVTGVGTRVERLHLLRASVPHLEEDDPLDPAGTVMIYIVHGRHQDHGPLFVDLVLLHRTQGLAPLPHPGEDLAGTALPEEEEEARALVAVVAALVAAAAGAGDVTVGDKNGNVS
ncbi:AAA+-type ATPase [Myotisia sp. PD_48]|nr:AAA+-type ATPase [Myotisia sp. PD_48]